MLRSLLMAGDVNSSTWEGSRAIHLAFQQGCLDMMNVLFDSGADANTRSETGTLLTDAVSAGKADIVKLGIPLGPPPVAAPQPGTLVCLSSVIVLLAAVFRTNRVFGAGFTTFRERAPPNGRANVRARSRRSEQIGNLPPGGVRFGPIQRARFEAATHMGVKRCLREDLND
jgi:hypothetical protein